MVFFSSLSLLVSMIGLYILLFASFASKKDQKSAKDLINNTARKIRIRQENKEPEESKPKKPNPTFILLLQTIIIGELVGLFFLTLTGSQTKFTILTINAAVLFIASFLCSGLTLLNVWLKKKTNIQFRIILQAITLSVGIILIKFSIRDKAAFPVEMFIFPIYFFYGTVVIALATMLLNVIAGNKTKKEEYNVSNYLLFVIISGLIIGTGLLFASSIAL